VGPFSTWSDLILYDAGRGRSMLLPCVVRRSELLLVLTTPRRVAFSQLRTLCPSPWYWFVLEHSIEPPWIPCTKRPMMDIYRFNVSD
jgi:hypothetical protein